MTFRRVVLAMSFIALAANAQSTNGSLSGGTDVDLGAVFDAFTVPFCYKRCLGGFEDNLEALLLLTNTLDNFEQLCWNYGNATACVKRSFCPLQPVYTVLTSGAEDLCVNKKQFFEENQACLRQNIDKVSQVCDNQCHLRESLADFSRDPRVKQSTGNLLALLGEFGGVCNATQCYLPCYRDSLNAACPGAGTSIVDGLLRPFFQLAAFIEKYGAAVGNFVDNNVPESCLFLTRNETLNEISG